MPLRLSRSSGPSIVRATRSDLSPICASKRIAYGRSDRVGWDNVLWQYAELPQNVPHLQELSMHPFARRCSQPSRKRHPGSYRPRLDCLEDRLPPGDTLGWLLVGSTLGWPALAAVETVQAESGGEWAAAEKTELRMGNGPFEMDHSQLQFARSE